MILRAQTAWYQIPNSKSAGFQSLRQGCGDTKMHALKNRNSPSLAGTLLDAGTFLNVLEPSWHGTGAFLERLLELCWNIPGTFLLGLCWNLPGILLELCWNIPGTFLLGLCWNLPGIFLELCWNIPGTFLLGPCWNLLGTVLEPCWNLVRFIMMELCWNCAGTFLLPGTLPEPG